jgi:predicted nucleic acid-binding protein
MKRSNAVVLKRLQRVQVGDAGISAITRSELEFGVEVSPRRQLDRVASKNIRDMSGSLIIRAKRHAIMLKSARL